MSAEAAAGEWIVPEGHDLAYANSLEVAVTENEVYLDFFVVEPVRKGEDFVEHVRFVSRIVLPKGQLKSLSETINRVVE